MALFDKFLCRLGDCCILIGIAFDSVSMHYVSRGWHPSSILGAVTDLLNIQAWNTIFFVGRTFQLSTADHGYEQEWVYRTIVERFVPQRSTSILVQLVRLWRMNTRWRLQAEDNVALGRTKTDGCAMLFRWQAFLIRALDISRRKGIAPICFCPAGHFLSLCSWMSWTGSVEAKVSDKELNSGKFLTICSVV